MSAGQVLPMFAAPTRENTLSAISRALLRIRSNGWCCEQLGKRLECSADTIKHATNEESLLNFHSIALLAFNFPDEFQMIETLWSYRATETVTPLDRLERIEREASAIRRELAA